MEQEKHYKDLSEEQIQNLLFVLEKTTRHHLNKLKEQFNVKSGGSLSQFHENVIHDLMMEQIDFSSFINWLPQLHLEGNNTLFVFEPVNLQSFNTKNLATIYNKSIGSLVKIYNINCEELADIKLVNLNMIDKHQLLYTFVAPAYIQNKNEKIDQIIPSMKKELFFAYILVDTNLKHVVLSLHPTQHLYSILGTTRKQDMDVFVPLFMNHFRKNFFPFNYKDPEWVVDAMCDIVEEYFFHNNPLIEKKMNHFNNNMLNDLMELFLSKEASFSNPSSELRIKKALQLIYEDELVNSYKMMPKQTPFRVFQHNTDKGVTTFNANSKGKPLSLIECREIIRVMSQNADTSKVGIIYSKDEKNYPYKVSKEENYYSLKRITTSTTEKEVVDNVLYKFNEYKYRQEISDTPGEIENS
ncbi:hypothetical protein COF81_16565 [Bacillus pseudomycoides]|uniref:Uncharacterized protein n=1 Tax=Bacillus pseudomycoides TaxID=64104 RepID=A0ABD6T5R9_9BACI|nr:hypothetical protein [Bacillus pseudomycoides]PEK39095.1 hypothetical protein CN691_03970 [Bacillus pseudomycoides]PHE94370.1 hypothetical protein COF81_16565 [Bacillus pseudomycoides]